MAKVIQHSVEFEKTSPEKLFGILMDPLKHSEIINAEVMIGRREGDSFSTFNGMVTGKNLTIEGLLELKVR